MSVIGISCYVIVKFLPSALVQNSPCLLYKMPLLLLLAVNTLPSLGHILLSCATRRTLIGPNLKSTVERKKEGRRRRSRSIRKIQENMGRRGRRRRIMAGKEEEGQISNHVDGRQWFFSSLL